MYLIHWVEYYVKSSEHHEQWTLLLVPIILFHYKSSCSSKCGKCLVHKSFVFPS